MTLFNKSKDYTSIVAPLKKMVTDLKDYVAAKQRQISNLETQKIQIEANIFKSEDEISKSNFTSEKISELLGSADGDDQQ